MKRFSTFLIAVALIAGIIGCAEVTLPTRYDLTMAVVPSAGGTATDLTNASPYVAGTSVNIKATANSGYQFVNWTAPAGTFTNVNGAQTTFAMPAENATATANFVPGYVFIIVANPALGGTATDLENASPYTAGTVVSITAVAGAAYHFVNWTAPAGTFANATAAKTTFTVPAENVVVTANFAIGYFRTDVAVALGGPATLPPKERNPCVILQILTNIVMDSVRVDLPDGGSVIVPAHTDVFSPGADQTTQLRFLTCVPGMAIAGGEYVFTALDAAGEPIPGVRDSDIWVGVEPPDPPTNVRAESTKDGIMVNWDESPIIPGSFEPAAWPQIGFYELVIKRIETGELVYGAARVSASSHLVPKDTANFIPGYDFGLSLSQMEDGTYRLDICPHSIAPEGSLGKGLEYNSSDPGQTIIFTIQNGEITIE